MAIVRPITAPEQARELWFLRQSLTDLEAEADRLAADLAELEHEESADVAGGLVDDWLSEPALREDTGGLTESLVDGESDEEAYPGSTGSSASLPVPTLPTRTEPENDSPAPEGSFDGRVLISVKTVESWLSDYDAAVARGDHVPGWWERVAVQLYRMVFPPSGAAYVREYADGTIEVILSPGPASGELAGQASLITGVIGAASRAGGAAAAARAASQELAEEVAETGLEEATGLPLPLPGRARGGDALRDRAPGETRRHSANTGSRGQPESLPEQRPDHNLRYGSRKRQLAELAPAKRPTGQTILGHFPDYVNASESTGARRFEIPESVWDRMTDADRWEANRKFLD